MFTTIVLRVDRMMHISCCSRAHADEIAAFFPDPLEVRVTPATPSEIDMTEIAGVVPGGTLVDRLRLDDYFAKLEGVCL